MEFLGKLRRHRNEATSPTGAEDFLSRFSFLTPQECAQLRAVGAGPAALYSAMIASPQAFQKIISRFKFDRLLGEMYSLISPEDKRVLETFTFSPPPLGVPTDEPSTIPEPDFDILERDRLFDELQFLKTVGTPEANQKARSVEDKLNSLLDSRFLNHKTAR